MNVGELSLKILSVAIDLNDAKAAIESLPDSPTAKSALAVIIRSQQYLQQIHKELLNSN